MMSDEQSAFILAFQASSAKKNGATVNVRLIDNDNATVFSNDMKIANNGIVIVNGKKYLNCPLQ